jgi:hypothetical protein
MSEQTTGICQRPRRRPTILAGAASLPRGPEAIPAQVPVEVAHALQRTKLLAPPKIRLVRCSAHATSHAATKDARKPFSRHSSIPDHTKPLTTSTPCTTGGTAVVKDRGAGPTSSPAPARYPAGPKRYQCRWPSGDAPTRGCSAAGEEKRGTHGRRLRARGLPQCVLAHARRGVLGVQHVSGVGCARMGGNAWRA